MVFMLAATLCSLLITVKNKIVMIGAGQALWGDWFQLIFAAAMAILALFLVAEGIQTLRNRNFPKPLHKTNLRLHFRLFLKQLS